jgi:aminopeptidase N
MLRDPRAADPDARFTAMLRGIVASYTHRAFSTEDLQAAVERVMTPAMALEEPHSMAWFFDEWVYATGIPHYAVRYDVRRSENGWVVRGTLTQSEVPETFLAAVPIYAQAIGGKPVLVGTVRASGPQTAFRFVAQQAPRKLVIDPGQTLLCTHD